MFVVVAGNVPCWCDESAWMERWINRVMLSCEREEQGTNVGIAFLRRETTALSVSAAEDQARRTSCKLC